MSTEQALRELNKEHQQREVALGLPVVSSRPTWITLDPGAECNLKCVQCPRENPTQPFVERVTDPAVVEHIKGALPYLQRLTLLGLGEPLLSDLFWSLIESPETKAIPIVDTSTNGTLLTDRYIERLLASNLTLLHVSIDGATEKTSKRIRGYNVAKVLRGLQRLCQRRLEIRPHSFRVIVVMTLMVENIEELPAMVRLASEHGVDSLWAQHIVLKSDGSQARWQIERDGWHFDYAQQHLSNEPSLNNKMIREAIRTAADLNFNFQVDSALWMPE